MSFNEDQFDFFIYSFWIEIIALTNCLISYNQIIFSLIESIAWVTTSAFLDSFLWVDNVSLSASCEDDSLEHFRLSVQHFNQQPVILRYVVAMDSANVQMSLLILFFSFFDDISAELDGRNRDFGISKLPKFEITI